MMTRTAMMINVMCWSLRPCGESERVVVVEEVGPEEEVSECSLGVRGWVSVVGLVSESGRGGGGGRNVLNSQSG